MDHSEWTPVAGSPPGTWSRVDTGGRFAWNRLMGRPVKQHEGGNKLRTYCKFKEEFIYESYLDCIMDRKKRVAVTRFRISNHQLNIERGRYCRPVLPVEMRICQFCSENKVEDEKHVLVDCERYDKIRSDTEFCELLCKYDNDTFEIFKTQNESEINVIAKFIYNMNEVRAMSETA